MFELLLFLLGLLGGGLSGLLGIGGGIIMVPLLLYAPPALGFSALGMKIVAGMTTVQSFAGTLSGAFGHQRFKRIHWRLVAAVGLPMTLASFAGSRFSVHVSEQLMLLVFALMALAASLLMLMPKKDSAHEEQLGDVEVNTPLAVVIGVIIGTAAGIIGQGGAFLYIPAMLYLLHIPTRICIGSALAIGILSSGAVLMGRLGTGQIPWQNSLILVAGVIIGAQLGSLLSQRTPRVVLRRVLAVVIFATAIKISLNVFEQYQQMAALSQLLPSAAGQAVI
ncbi:MAG: sulfite exporter TauE/SafE family protein [Thiogranum sp.]|jgi:hypothetical protein|nr:sulfite exporter TauE/SafE family protein [Thiogranum sp.]